MNNIFISTRDNLATEIVEKLTTQEHASYTKFLIRQLKMNPELYNDEFHKTLEFLVCSRTEIYFARRVYFASSLIIKRINELRVPYCNGHVKYIRLTLGKLRDIVHECTKYFHGNSPEFNQRTECMRILDALLTNLENKVNPPNNN